ncbi:MAG: hypothetical protein IJF70_06770 [Opitutales bacterium]|nr:hypothetical protein [Opitutales bacterium]
MKDKPYDKNKLNSMFCDFYKKQQDITFDDFENDSIDGHFVGKIAVQSKFVSHSLLCLYEEKIANILSNCGFATTSIGWMLDTNNENIQFVASANKILKN